MKFKHLKSLDISGRTSWCDLPEVSPKARLELRPALEANKPYFNALLKSSGKRARQLARGGRMTAEMLEENRDEDRDLFPAHVVVAWDGIEDEGGSLALFSRENCREFLEQLPDWLFDRVRVHASTPENYLSDDEAPPSAEGIAGNSASG